MEFETVKEAVEYLHLIASAKDIKVYGEEATVEDIQEIMMEVYYSISYFLGYEIIEGEEAR